MLIYRNLICICLCFARKRCSLGGRIGGIVAVLNGRGVLVARTRDYRVLVEHCLISYYDRIACLRAEFHFEVYKFDIKRAAVRGVARSRGRIRYGVLGACNGSAVDRDRYARSSVVCGRAVTVVGIDVCKALAERIMERKGIRCVLRHIGNGGRQLIFNFLADLSGSFGLVVNGLYNCGVFALDSPRRRSLGGYVDESCVRASCCAGGAALGDNEIVTGGHACDRSCSVSCLR